MKEFVEYIVKHLVDNPEAVHVSEVVGETTVVYELKVDQPDMGKVIGKNGRTAHASSFKRRRPQSGQTCDSGNFGIILHRSSISQREGQSFSPGR